MTDWCPDLSSSNAPRYLAIADRIEADVKSGRLAPGDRLPAQRDLAHKLGLDFTTVARGYTEARRRGIISSQVGSGTYVSSDEDAGLSAPSAISVRRDCQPDHSMNLPPEPDDKALRMRMQSSLATLSNDLVPLLRYQDLESSEQDKKAASDWLKGARLNAGQERIVFSPGAQATLSAILGILAAPGEEIACEAVTYPGIRALCIQQGLKLNGLPTDEKGIEPDAFQSICEQRTIKALYLNPTLNNPTTRIVPENRRQELVDIARKFGVAILEDDPYSHLLVNPPKPFAEIAPEITWYIGSLSKTLGAGLRLAYVATPDKSGAWNLQRALRTTFVMPAPLTVAAASQWITDGTAAALLEHTRKESAIRQSLAEKRLSGFMVTTNPSAFHLWLELPQGWTRSLLVSQLRQLPIGIVESDPFTMAGPPAEAVRVCLGGPVDRSRLAGALDALAQTVESSPLTSSAFF